MEGPPDLKDFLPPPPPHELFRRVNERNPPLPPMEAEHDWTKVDSALGKAEKSLGDKYPYGTVKEGISEIRSRMREEPPSTISDVHDIFHSSGEVRAAFNYTIMMISYDLPPGKPKNLLLESTGMDVGDDVFIAPQTIFDPVRPDKITIESDAFIGWGSRLFTHIIPGRTGRGEDEYNYAEGYLTIKSTAFIGAYSMVFPGADQPGVTVAGKLFNNSVLSEDVPADESWGGTPARKIRERRW